MSYHAGIYTTVPNVFTYRYPNLHNNCYMYVTVTKIDEQGYTINIKCMFFYALIVGIFLNIVNFMIDV